MSASSTETVIRSPRRSVSPEEERSIRFPSSNVHMPGSAVMGISPSQVFASAAKAPKRVTEDTVAG